LSLQTALLSLTTTFYAGEVILKTLRTIWANLGLVYRTIQLEEEAAAFLERAAHKHFYLLSSSGH
jgi:hypothetical protein